MNWIAILQIAGYLVIGSFVGAITYTVMKVMDVDMDEDDRKETSIFAGGAWPLTLIGAAFSLVIFLAIMLGKVIANGLYWIYSEITNPKENV